MLLLEIGSAFGLLVAWGGAAPVTVAEPTVARVESCATVAKALPATVATVVGAQLVPEAQVLEVLRAAGRPLTNDELAGVLSVHKGTASKRVAALGAAVHKVRVGRHVALTVAGAGEPISLVAERRRRALGRMTRVA